MRGVDWRRAKPATLTPTLSRLWRERGTARLLRAFLWVVQIFCLPFASHAEDRAATEFYRALAVRPSATVADVVRAAARFRRYAGPDRTDHEIEHLREAGVPLDPDLWREAGRPVTHGAAAAVMLSGLEYKGSWLRRWFPNSRRYAFRVAANIGLVPPETHPDEWMSGPELLAFLTRMEQRFGAAESRHPARMPLMRRLRAFRAGSSGPVSMLRFPMTAELTEVTGEVEIRKSGETRWTAAGAGRIEIERGDEIATGIEGRAVLKFEKVYFEISPLTHLAVGLCVQEGYEHSVEVLLDFGRVRTVSSKSPGREIRARVIMPTAVAGVTGTVQEVSYLKGPGAAVRTDEGAGYVAPVDPGQLPAALRGFFGLAPQQPSDLGAFLEAAFNTGGPETVRADRSMPVGEGMSAVVSEPSVLGAVRRPLDLLRDAALGDFLPAGATEAEREAAQTSADILDAPPARLSQEQLQSDQLQSSTSAATSTINDALVNARRPPLPP